MMECTERMQQGASPPAGTIAIYSIIYCFVTVLHDIAPTHTVANYPQGTKLTKQSKQDFS